MQLNDCIAVKNHRWNYGFYEKNGILVLNNCIGDNKENCFNIKKISGAVQHKDISIDEE